MEKFNNIKKFKLDEIIGLSGYSLLFTSIASRDSSYAPYLSYTSCSLIVLYALLNLNEHMKFKKYVPKIKDEYNDIIKKYNKLNKIFNFNNPVEAYAMYTYMLYNGYLSCNKKFNYSTKDTCDISDIMGCNIFLGRGVCRHISSFFNDTLKDAYFDSDILSVSFPEGKLKINKTKFDPVLDKKCANFVLKYKNIDSKNSSFMSDLLCKCRNKDESLEYTYDLSYPLVHPNHVINEVYKDDEIYLLDPTNLSFYFLDMDNLQSVFNDDYRLVVYHSLGKTLDDFKDKAVNYYNPNKKFLDITYKRTHETCDRNKDIFEKFYNDNKDEYHDIAKKLTRVI